MRKTFALAVVLALTLAGPPVQAHHSMAMFDRAREVALTGKVKQFQWTNPHCYIQLMVKDASGKVTEWSLELGAPMYLYANGWRPSTLKAGTEIKVSINPLRNGQPGGVVVEATNADGKPIGKRA